MATGTGLARAATSSGKRKIPPKQGNTCPICKGLKWVKSFTPWGCPTSTPCPQCASRK